MIDILKKSILFGMGAVAYTKESVEQYVKDLSKEGVNPEEGKKMVEEMLGKAKEAKEKQKGELQEMVRKTLGEMGVATKEDIEELKKLIKRD